MGNRSVWQDEVSVTSFPQLKGDINVDVIIIGGGITGITAAYLLTGSGRTVAVLEARKIGEGTTGFSTGNLYATVGGEGLHKIAQKFDDTKVKEVVESRAAAVDFIEQVVKTNNIDCDFKRVPWCLFASEGQRKSFIERERESAIKSGLSVVDTVPYPIPVEAGFCVPGQAQFNPLKYVVSLAAAIESDRCRIYENTRASRVEEGDICLVETETGRVTASRIIMATHTPKGMYAVHTVLGPYREYAVAAILNGGYPEAGIFWDMQELEHYSVRTFASAEGRVIMVLGETHKVGQKEANAQCFQKLESFLRKHYDVAEVVRQWSAQQYRPADTIPYIGISPGDTKTYIATGFAADGLTYGTLAAMIITDHILEKENRWSKTYDASRLTPVASAPEFIKENVNVVYELVKDWLSTDVGRFSEVQLNEGKIMEIDGAKHAVHRDAEGKLHVVSAICPHMGCIVHWNAMEQSWDCPCHGSRFSRDGDVLEGPAINPLKNISGD